MKKLKGKILKIDLKKINKFKEFILIIVFGLVFLLPFYRNDFYVSHDAESLIVKAAATYKAFSDGQIPPRWAGDLNYNYGVPVLNFYYPFASYLTSAFSLVGFGWEFSYKLIITAFFILAGVTFYIYLKQIFSKEVSFAGALFYMLSPYHFVDIFVRGHIGEIIALGIFPLVILFLHKTLVKPKISSMVLGGICYGVLILSHNILALMFSVLLLGYIVVFSRSFFIFLNSLLLFLIGLGFSAYFWLPALLESKYINSEIFISGYFQDHFIKLGNLIYAPWGWGVNINEVGGLSPHIGIIYAILVLVAFYALRVKNHRKEIIFWFSALVISAFFTNEISSLLWSKFHILEQFQFPWRFIAISSFAACVLVAYALSYINKKAFTYLVIIIILLISSSYIQVKGYIKHEDSFYLNYPGTGAYHGESTTIWTAGDASSYPAFPIEIISGKGQILDYKRKSNIHEFTVIAEDSVKVKDNTVYYPGWRVFVGDKEVPIEFQDPNHRGLITFKVPDGKHDVEVKFTETILRKVANIISLISFAFVILALIFRNKFDKLILRR